MKKIGIYRILCLENNKIYIGQSVEISTRWIRHRFHLKRGDHPNPHLQAAWNLYGEDRFEFSILEECLEDQLDSKELQYMNIYETLNNSKGYNIISDLTREELANKSRNRRKSTEGRIYPSQPVVCIEEKTGEVCVLGSAKEVVEVLGVSLNSVQECLATWRGTLAKVKRWTIKGFILIYLEDYREDRDYLVELYPAKIEEPKHDKRKNQKGTPIKSINIETGETRSFPTKNAMCRELNLLPSKLEICLKHPHRQHRGYRFELEKDLVSTN